MAAGLCSLGLAPFTTGWRLAAVAIAVVCWVGVGVLLLVTRRRQGIRGLRGPARNEATTYLACGVAVFICGITPSADMRWIYVMAGIVGGAMFWIVLDRRGSVLR